MFPGSLIDINHVIDPELTVGGRHSQSTFSLTPLEINIFERILSPFNINVFHSLRDNPRLRVSFGQGANNMGCGCWYHGKIYNWLQLAEDPAALSIPTVFSLNDENAMFTVTFSPQNLNNPIRLNYVIFL